MYESWEEFTEALQGEFGEEEQEAALDFAEESGLLQQWQEADEGAGEGGGGGDEEYVEALREEVARVEQQLGRQLTQGEVSGMLDTLSTEDLEQQVVPDFLDEFGAALAGTAASEDGRVHLGAEAAQRVMEEREAGNDNGIPQPHFEAPEPAGEGFGYEDE